MAVVVVDVVDDVNDLIVVLFILVAKYCTCTTQEIITVLGMIVLGPALGVVVAAAIAVEVAAVFVRIEIIAVLAGAFVALENLSDRSPSWE